MTPQQLLERAQAAYDEGKFKAAEIDAKTALQQDPTNEVGRKLLGEIRFHQRDLEAAAIEFSKSLEKLNDPEVAALYAQSLLESGQREKLLELAADGYFAFASQQAEYLAALARAQALSGDTFTGQQTLEAALALAPENPRVQLAHAVLLVHHSRQIEEAGIVLRQLTQDHPTFDDAWSFYGDYALSIGDLPLAEEAFAEASNINRYRLDDRVSLVAVLVDQERYDEATKVLEKLDLVIPTHPGVNYAQARIAMAQGNTDLALEELAEVFNIDPGHMPSVYLAANAHFRNGNLESARTHLTTLLEQQPRNINARQMLATIYLQNGEPERSSRLATRLLKEEPMNTKTMKILAMALAAQGMHDASADVYEELVDTTPDSAIVRMELGTELARAGDINRGIEELQAARELDPANGEIRSRLVLAYTAKGDQEAAERELEEYRKLLGPADASANVLAGQVALRQGKVSTAQAEFSRALELDPGNFAAREGMAALSMLEDDPDAAVAILKAGVLANPEDINNLRNLAAVYESQGDTDSMVATLEQAIQTAPEALEPRLTLARYRFSNNNAGETLDLLIPVREAHDDDPRVHQLMLGAFLALGQTGPAVNSGLRLLELMPDNPLALRLVAQAEMADGNLPAAEKYFREALALRPDDKSSRRLLIGSLLAQNKLGEISQQLEQLPEGIVPDALVNLARGRIALTLGNAEQAESLLRLAFAEAPDNNSLLFLSTALLQQGKDEEAGALLESWLETHPEDLVILRQAGPYYLGQGRENDAILIYETLNKLVPGNAVVLNDLAWSYRKSDTRKALDYVEQALALAPANGAILDTKAMILFEQGDFEQALVVNQQAIDVAGEYLPFQFHRAQILAAAGDSSGAKVLLQGLLENESYSGREQAEALLRDLDVR